ncbi:MAG TPA: hypothetical protein VLJ59_17555 [Mycobacteriales bacterium]|nr:hypothetical protein [Mycobacteriales bacterium]
MNTTDLDRARQVAEAVLYEGYLLYPYRASAAKNQVRWQFGVLVPPAWAETGSGEPTASRTECLFEPRAGAVLHLVLRCLQVQARTIQRADGSGGFEPVASLTVDGTDLFGYDEAAPREVEVDLPIGELTEEGERSVPVSIPAGVDVEDVLDSSGKVVGRTVRERWELSGALRVTVVPLVGPYGACHLSVRVENTSDWSAAEGGGRDVALRHSFVSAHLLLALTNGTFVSPVDPPEWAKVAVGECRNEHIWPVLVGEDDRREVMLASPIILSEYPEIAPESPGELFDSTEIDEILLLRTMTLTDEEKREARATDARAAAIIDRADTLPPEVLDRLHGAVRYLQGVTAKRPSDTSFPELRELPDSDVSDEFSDQPGADRSVPWWDPGADASVSPETDTVQIGTIKVGRGSQVLLCPGRRRADAQDLFLVGRTATVQAVLHDVDGETHLAVTLDDDMAAEVLSWQGRYMYFSPDEVEPLEAATASEGT